MYNCCSLVRRSLHIHHREEASFYLLEGNLDITLGEKKVKATTGDFVQVSRGTVHAFLNAGSTTARMLLFFSPAGMDKYFEEVLEPVQNRSADTNSYRGVDCLHGGCRTKTESSLSERRRLGSYRILCQYVRTRNRALQPGIHGSCFPIA
jgi:hypothetical protein